MWGHGFIANSFYEGQRKCVMHHNRQIFFNYFHSLHILKSASRWWYKLGKRNTVASSNNCNTTDVIFLFDEMFVIAANTHFYVPKVPVLSKMKSDILDIKKRKMYCEF